MRIDQGINRFAYKKGLFVISQTDDNVRIRNDKKFKPRSFISPDQKQKIA